MSKKKNNSPTLEQQIEQLIEKYYLQDKLSVDLIKKWVWEEKGNMQQAIMNYQEKVVDPFTKIPESIHDINIIMEVFMNAWKSFPNKPPRSWSFLNTNSKK